MLFRVGAPRTGQGHVARSHVLLGSTVDVTDVGDSDSLHVGVRCDGLGLVSQAGNGSRVRPSAETCGTPRVHLCSSSVLTPELMDYAGLTRAGRSARQSTAC